MSEGQFLQEREGFEVLAASRHMSSDAPSYPDPACQQCHSFKSDHLQALGFLELFLSKRWHRDLQMNLKLGLLVVLLIVTLPVPQLTHDAFYTGFDTIFNTSRQRQAKCDQSHTRVHALPPSSPPYRLRFAIWYTIFVQV